MNVLKAQSAVALSAALVFGLYAYRKLTETATGGASLSEVPQVGHFAIGFAFTYVTLSFIAVVAPELGGMLAVLVAVGDLLINGQSLFKDLSTGLRDTATN